MPFSFSHRNGLVLVSGFLQRGYPHLIGLFYFSAMSHRVLTRSQADAWALILNFPFSVPVG